VESDGADGGGQIGTVREITLPMLPRQGAAALAGDTVYYAGLDYKIYSASADDPQQGKAVYDLSIPTQGEGEFTYPSLRSENGRVFLSFRWGLTTEGNMLLDSDGVAMELPGKTRAIGDWLVAVDNVWAPHPENLFLRGPDDTAFRVAGASDLVYGFGDGIAIDGNFLYTAATTADAGGGWQGETYVYRTDLTSGESRRVTEEPLGGAFYLDGGNAAVYYLNREGLIRRQALAGGQAETVMVDAVEDFALTAEGLCYVSPADHLPYRAGEDKTMLPDGAGDVYATVLEVWNGTLCAVSYVTSSPTNESVRILIGENPRYSFSATDDQIYCTDGVGVLLIHCAV
jgi:hypothetical protein